MEMHLQPLATTCSASGEPFEDGARVASFLVRRGAAMEILRFDVLEKHAATFTPDGIVACRWVHPYKARKQGENADRALKLTAEHLFVALADPTTEPTPENTRLVQFLALMLERKKILKPRGKSTDGARNRYEHAKSKQIFEVAAGELTPEFFVAVQQQLSVLVGAPKAKAGAAVEPAGAGAASAATASAAAAATAAALPVTDEATPAAETAPAVERAESPDTAPAPAPASAIEGPSDSRPARAASPAKEPAEEATEPAPNDSPGDSRGGTAAA